MEYAQRQKRAHPKVRTGCTVCKARRIKCDENKPACSKCQRSKRQCHYEVPKAWLFEPLKVLPPPIKQPVVMLGSQSELREFQFFKEATAPQFAGRHELAQKFWKEFVVQAAYSDPLVFKLAVAMGARHEATHTSSQELEMLAASNHATALTTMARNLPHMSVEVSLLCCALLGSYANLCEEVPATAAMHISLGLKILREETIQKPSNLSEAMADYIVPMFSELELASAIFTIPTCDVEVHCPREEYIPSVPDTFANLYEAKRILAKIFRWQIYITTAMQNTQTKLNAALNDVDALLGRWRQTLTRYGTMVAPVDLVEFQKARKMIFQSKLFVMCKGAAKNTIFIDNTRVRVISVDFSNPEVTTVLCLLKTNMMNDTWRPLALKPERDTDDLDVWPTGEPAGHDGNNQIIRITLGR